VYSLYKDSVSEGKKILSYSAIIQTIAEIFPDSTKTKIRINSQPFLCFSNLSLDKENIKPSTSNLDLLTYGQKLNYSVINANVICTPHHFFCNGQRAIKEVTLNKSELSLKVAGLSVFPIILKQLSTNHELEHTLREIQCMDVCTGFDPQCDSPMLLETWSLDETQAAHARIRSPMCHGIIPPSYKTKTCCKCQEWNNNLSKKRKLELVEVSDDGEDLEELDELSDGSDEMSITSDEDDGDIDADDPDFNPAVLKIDKINNAEDLMTLRELLAKLGPKLDSTFLQLIETQIENSNVKDKRLRKWDMR